MQGFFFMYEQNTSLNQHCLVKYLLKFILFGYMNIGKVDLSSCVRITSARTNLHYVAFLPKTRVQIHVKMVTIKLRFYIFIQDLMHFFRKYCTKKQSKRMCLRCAFYPSLAFELDFFGKGVYLLVHCTLLSLDYLQLLIQSVVYFQKIPLVTFELMNSCSQYTHKQLVTLSSHSLLQVWPSDPHRGIQLMGHTMLQCVDWSTQPEL